MWMFKEKHFQTKNLINKKRIQRCLKGQEGGAEEAQRKGFFLRNWKYITIWFIARHSRAHETDTSNHQTSQTKARIKFPHKQKGMFLNFCRRGGLSRSRSTASTLNDSGVRGSISSILFHQEIRIKDPKQPKIHWSNNYNFSAALPPLFSTEMKNVNEPTRDSLGLRILWNSNSSLVFFIWYSTEAQMGEGQLKKYHF